MTTVDEVLRTTGAVREFLPDPVDDATLARILDTARFAPSGGNRQGWRVVVVRDAATRRALRDLYRPGWAAYVAQSAAGLVPWAPVTDEAAEVAAIAAAEATEPPAVMGGLADTLHEAPVVLVLLADLRRLAAVDKDLPRYSFVGGASIYPFAWSVLLAARAEGLGGVLTTMNVRREADLKALLGVPDDLAVAGVLVLGHPATRATRLRRARVEEFATVDRFDGEPFGREA